MSKLQLFLRLVDLLRERPWRLPLALRHGSRGGRWMSDISGHPAYTRICNRFGSHRSDTSCVLRRRCWYFLLLPANHPEPWFCLGIPDKSYSNFSHDVTLIPATVILNNHLPLCCKIFESPFSPASASISLVDSTILPTFLFSGILSPSLRCHIIVLRLPPIKPINIWQRTLEARNPSHPGPPVSNRSDTIASHSSLNSLFI